MIRLLIDEQLSPTLVGRLAEKGIYARHVAHSGLAGASDPALWRYAFTHDLVVVTANVGDFIQLAGGSGLHAGLIVLRESGLTRDEQWQRLAPVIDHIRQTGIDMINRVVEIRGIRDFDLRWLPAARG